MLVDFNMSKTDNITAFILAGGQSSRMGTDKAVIMFKAKPMIEHVRGALSISFKNIILISNHITHQSLGLPVIKDAFENIGPLGGIIAGLRHSQTELNLFMACDMPMVTPQIINALVEQTKPNSCTTTSYNGKIETLCTLFPKSALPQLEEMVNDQRYRLYDVLDSLKAQVVDVSHLCSFNPFANINTPEDLQ